MVVLPRVYYPPTKKLAFLRLDFLQCYQKVSFAFLLVSVSVGEVEAEDEERRPPAAA